MTLENPRVHAERGFPEYTTDFENAEARRGGVTTHSVFGHIVPDYTNLLRKGFTGILADVEDQRPWIQNPEEEAFLDSVVVAAEAVSEFALRLAERCRLDAEKGVGLDRAEELWQMAFNLKTVPSGPARTFWQALQSVWLLHLVFHSTMNGNAVGRLDQYAWPYLEADLAAGRIDMIEAAELADCFCLKFNERAKTTEEQRPSSREKEHLDLSRRTWHSTSSQLGTTRDRLDATNHWLQNIIIGGLTPRDKDGTNPLTFLLLESYRRNGMTNSQLTVRVHRDSPDALIREVSKTLKEGGGMPAIFNDEALVPSLENLKFPRRDALDYTNDGCWEIIIPGRTDFKFQRFSLMLCLEGALNQGRSRLHGSQHGPDMGDARTFSSFEDVWEAFLTQMDAMIVRTVNRIVETVDERSVIAPAPLLSSLIEGAIEKRRDMTAGGSKFRTFGMLAESAAHAIDSLSAL